MLTQKDQGLRLQDRTFDRYIHFVLERMLAFLLKLYEQRKGAVYLSQVNIDQALSPFDPYVLKFDNLPHLEAPGLVVPILIHYRRLRGFLLLL